MANNGNVPVSVTPFALVSRADRSVDPDQWAAHVGPIAVSQGAANYVNWGDVEGAPQLFATTGGWVGYTDHYWLTALVPDQRVPVQLQQRGNTGKAYQADYRLVEPLDLAPGKKVTYNSRFFAGAKEVKLLDKYQDEQGIVQFGHAIDWGWFGIIEKPIFYYLDWLFRLVGNFGVAIILLTITIRLLIFPIAQRQFASMAAMRAIQPKMKVLQERHKDDKQRQQQEIMKLYKEEKVNPLAGCLPILIQIPIMFALYKVLLLTIEMRHQPFVGWIKDLSAPDPLTPLNLFGLLAFTPPHFIAIGVIPILLGISMYFQFKLNPAPMDDMQKQVFSDHAVDDDVRDGAVRGRPAGLLDHRRTSSRSPSNGCSISGTRRSRSRSRRIRPRKRRPSERLRRRSGRGRAKDLRRPDRLPEVGAQARASAEPGTCPRSRSPAARTWASRRCSTRSTNRNGLARTSNTPGRTQELNFFDVGEPLKFRLVDMPGYGFAKAPKDIVSASGAIW